MYHACMSTKTISIDLEAYYRLSHARRDPKESFSQVIHRAVWHEQGRTCGAFLQALAASRPLEKKSIDLLERAQLADHAPESPWPNA
jgi:predicted CopG family antitoxin